MLEKWHQVQKLELLGCVKYKIDSFEINSIQYCIINIPIKLIKMKNKKNRYKRIKESFIVGASSGLMAGMIFIGSANTVFAKTADLNTSKYSQNV